MEGTREAIIIEYLYIYNNEWYHSEIITLKKRTIGWRNMNKDNDNDNDKDNKNKNRNKEYEAEEVRGSIHELFYYLNPQYARTGMSSNILGSLNKKRVSVRLKR